MFRAFRIQFLVVVIATLTAAALAACGAELSEVPGETVVVEKGGDQGSTKYRAKR